MYIPENIAFSERDYLAPTVWSIGTRYISNWNYYSTLDQAIKKYLYLHGQPGGVNYTAAGFVSFPDDQKPHTFGINCDFYILKDGEWQLTSYKYLRTVINTANPPAIVFRFLRTDGSGIFYSVFEPYYFGMSATSISSVPAEKLRALDDYFRAVQEMKYKYNALVGFLNSLGKKQLNAIEQQIFNEGMLTLNSFNQQLTTIKGLEFEYGESGVIGTPIILIILIVVILSAATAWTISSIVTEKEKTKRISDSYDLNKWVAAKKLEIAQQVTSGQISSQAANSIYKTLDDASKVANTVATNASNTQTTIGSVANILKWGVIGYLGFMLFRSLGNKKSDAAKV